MSAGPAAPRQETRLDRTTSRTRTARTALPLPSVVGAWGGGFDELEAGPATPAATSAQFPAAAVRYQLADRALRVRAVSAPAAGHRFALGLDLGANVDVARLELYGNVLLPPRERDGRPVHNFGLPRALAVAVAEEPQLAADHHRRPVTNRWWDRPEGFHQRFATYDLRATWGWTTIALPPTFGRYLLLMFADLPRVVDEEGASRRGVDVRQLVLYPFREDVDHRAEIEYAPVASRQTAFDATSPYWDAVGGDPPTPAGEQSLGYLGDVAGLPLPSVLSGIESLGPAAPVRHFESGAVPLDGEDRIMLTLATTTDETPLVAAVHLRFRPVSDPGAKYVPPQLALPDYEIEVQGTNDPAAAASAELEHASWRRLAAPRRVTASQGRDALLRLREPAWVRYVRLVVAPLRPAGDGPEPPGRLVLAGLSLMRPRDFFLKPEPDEDIRVDHAVLRLRGERLFDDYAYADGSSGLAVSLDVREGGGAFEPAAEFRSLLQLLENAQTRAYSNQRYPHHPVQRLREEVSTATDGRQRVETVDSMSDATARVRPGFGNTQTSRSGTLTSYPREHPVVDNKLDEPADNTGRAPFTRLPAVPPEGLRTSRSYEFDPVEMVDEFVRATPLPTHLDHPDDLRAAWNGLVGLSTALAGQGAPVSVGLGVNGSVSGSLVAGASVGAAGSIGVQMGGGTTRTFVSGDQATIVDTETQTVHAVNRTETTATGHSEQTTASSADENRQTTRWDESEDVRRAGLGVRYGGAYEDVLLVALPVGRLLRAPRDGAGEEPPEGDAVRIRVDHLPPGVTLDVEWRGAVLPREREA